MGINFFGVQGGFAPLPAVLDGNMPSARGAGLYNLTNGDDNLTANKKLGKNARIELRVTEQLKQYLALKAAESNKTLNDYIGNILQNFDYAEKLTTIEAIQKQKIKLLSNIANNLNQLAKHCNSVHEAPQKEILLSIFDEIKKIR